MISIGNFLEPKDESSSDGKHIFPLLSMKQEDNVLGDGKPNSVHVQLESQSGEDKGMFHVSSASCVYFGVQNNKAYHFLSNCGGASKLLYLIVLVALFKLTFS